MASALIITGALCWATWLVGVVFFTGYFGREFYRSERKPTAVEWLRVGALTLGWPATPMALLLEEL